MPNWCSNDITISGPESKIKALWESAQKKGFLQSLNDIGEWDWHRAVDEWGTKWEVEIEHLEHKPGEITGMFESAWSPPTQALVEWFEENPDCHINLKYFEPGMCFVGEWNDGCDEYIEFDDPGEVPDQWYDYWNLADVYEQDEEE